MNKLEYDDIPRDIIEQSNLLIRLHLIHCGVDMDDPETALKFTLGLSGLSREIAKRTIDRHEDNIRYKRYKRYKK